MEAFAILSFVLLSILVIGTMYYASAQSQAAPPKWIEIVNKMWSQNQISDQEFVNVYKYLEDSRILAVYDIDYAQDASFEKQLVQTKQIASYLKIHADKLTSASSNVSDLDHFTPMKSRFIYIEPLPRWYAYSDNIIPSAKNYWIKTDNVKFNLVSIPSDDTITVKWIRETGLPVSGYTIGNKIIEIGLGDTKCDGIWKPYDQSFVSEVLRHELGHVLGHKHSANPSDVMYPILSDKKYILTANMVNSQHIC